jgi:hypothetical protein
MLEGVRRAAEELARPLKLDKSAPYENWDGYFHQHGRQFDKRTLEVIPIDGPPPVQPERFNPRDRHTPAIWKNRRLIVARWLGLRPCHQESSETVTLWEPPGYQDLTTLKEEEIMKITEIKTAEPFNILFPIHGGVSWKIQEDMKEKGFDRSRPITIWSGKGIVVDGHARLQAAKNLGLEEVPVVELEFENEDAALEYAIQNQRNRRNLTGAEILRFIEAVDKLRGAGRPPKELVSRDAKFSDKSAAQTAKIVGTSQATVERARQVIKDTEEKNAVMTGKKSISRAAQDARGKRK